MSRLTITIDDEIHRALKETAARQGRSIGTIVEESLRLRGIKPIKDARELIHRARSRAKCSREEADRIAVEETRLHRSK